MAELNERLHYELLHAMMRKENDEADGERARGVLTWLSRRLAAVGRILNTEERRVLSVIWVHWLKYHAARSRTTLGTLVNQEDKSDGMANVLELYDGHAEYLKPADHISVETIYESCVDDCERVMLHNYLQDALVIANAGLAAEKRGERHLIGVKDARMFLIQKLQSSVFASARGIVGGSMKDTAGDLVAIYENNERGAADKSLVIPTGIAQLDDTITGMRRRSFNLILGAAGQRKSALARTIAYNAAMNGFRVLFLPLEMHRDEELAVFGIMHGTNATYFEGTEDLSVDRFEQGRLTAEEKAFIESELVPEMKNNIGDNLTILQLSDTSWDAVRGTIETQNFLNPLDVVVIDHFALIDASTEKDQTAAINAFAKKAKDFVLYDLDNGRGGVALISPAHGSRKGIEDARRNEGNWVREGIYMYSGLEKAADMIMFTYMDPEMQKTGYMKLGTCKSRRSADVPAMLVGIDHSTHVVGGTRMRDAVESTSSTYSNLKDPEMSDYGMLR